MKKQLRDIIQLATARATMAADIITSVLPEVVRNNVRQVLSPYLGQPEPSSQGAGECPFGHTAESSQAPQADAGTCPVTGQAASAEAKSDTATVKEAAKESAAAKSASTKAKAPKKKMAAKSAPATKPKAKAKASDAKKPAAKKSAAKKPAAKKPAAKKSAAKKSAKKPAKKTAPAKKSEPKSVKVSALTAAQLKKMKRSELYPVAQELEIRGRKDMKKAELLDAIQKDLGLS